MGSQTKKSKRAAIDLRATEIEVIKNSNVGQRRKGQSEGEEGKAGGDNG